MKLSTIATLVIGALFTSMNLPAQDQADENVVLVPQIKQASYIELRNLPPTLVVKVSGEVPTGGYSNAHLARANYVEPPKDGIQDLFFLIQRPPADAIVPQVITPVEASLSWKQYRVEAPWIKGLRVHGANGEVKLIRFEKP